MPAARAPETYAATTEDYAEMLDFLESESAVNDAVQDLAEKLPADPAVSESAVALLYPTEAAAADYRCPLGAVTPAELERIKERLQEAALGQTLDPEETWRLAQDTAVRLIGPAAYAATQVAAGAATATELATDYAPHLPEQYNRMSQAAMALLQRPLQEQEHNLTQYLADPTQEQSLATQDHLIRIAQQIYQVMQGNPPNAYPEPEMTLPYWRREENRSEYAALHATWQESRQEYAAALAADFRENFDFSGSSIAGMIEEYPAATGRLLQIYLADTNPGSEAAQLLLNELAQDNGGYYPTADLREALEKAYRRARE